MKKRRGIRWVAGQDTPPKVYITRVFNFGTWEEWQQMKKQFSPHDIEEAIKHPVRGSWTPRGQALAETLYGYRLSAEGLISYDA